LGGSIIGNYQTLRDGLNDLVRTPRLLAASMTQLFALPADLSNAAARDFRNAFGSLFDAAALIDDADFTVSIMPPIGGGLVMFGQGDASSLTLATPAREQLNGLNVATDQLMESLAVASWVEAIARGELGSTDEAALLRAQGTAQMTRLMRRASAQGLAGSLPERAWHDAMQALLAAFLGDMQTRGRQGRRLSSYTPQGFEPVWLISYKLYGTVDFAEEILTLNASITHPLLVQPGVALRVVKR
jgi:hypothetical protein